MARRDTCEAEERTITSVATAENEGTPATSLGLDRQLHYSHLAEKPRLAPAAVDEAGKALEYARVAEVAHLSRNVVVEGCGEVRFSYFERVFAIQNFSFTLSFLNCTPRTNAFLLSGL